MPRFKMGKLAPRYNPHTPALFTYADIGKLPQPKDFIDWTAKVSQWGMMANDNVGDCTCAAAGHMIECWTANSSHEYVPTDQAILSAYSAITGYNPADPNTDQGAVCDDVLNYWKNNGISGHQIAGHAYVEPHNHNHIRLGVEVFGGVYIGFQVPSYAMDLFDRNRAWTVAMRSAPIEGGHCVPLLAYNKHWLWCLTWNRVQAMSWQFFDTYCDEAYVPVSTDWLNEAGETPEGFNMEVLVNDLQYL